MKLYAEIGGKRYTFDASKGVDISIPLQFNGDQPNSYNVAKAVSRAYEVDGFVGDTGRGGGCNFESISFIPHCNGTHTECVGHISDERISVHSQLNDSLIPSTVITLTPVEAGTVDDHYQPPLDSNDRVITRSVLQREIERRPQVVLEHSKNRNKINSVVQQHGNQPTSLHKLTRPRKTCVSFNLKL